jgi:hypothetical protein
MQQKDERVVKGEVLLRNTPSDVTVRHVVRVL